MVARLRLDRLQDQPLIQLSNGETKRLRLAKALLRNPLLLLLDTPLAGLDAASRLDFDALLAEIAAAGTTLVLATAPAEIPALITDVAELAAGCIQRVRPAAGYAPPAAPALPLPDAAALQALWPAAPPAFTTLVKLEDVTVRYGERIILDKLNWEIKPGERWALLGPNGAGKSTVLSLLNGDNPQAYGQNITLFDRRRGTGESIWDIKRRIGYASPELLQYFPGQPTCLQVVASGFVDTLGPGRPTPAQLAEARQWLAVLRLTEHAARPLRQAPASVQRLCLVARALVKAPPLLLLDEPGQGLDAAQQPYFRGRAGGYLCPKPGGAGVREPLPGRYSEQRDAGAGAEAAGLNASRVALATGCRKAAGPAPAVGFSACYANARPPGPAADPNGPAMAAEVRLLAGRRGAAGSRRTSARQTALFSPRPECSCSYQQPRRGGKKLIPNKQAGSSPMAAVAQRSVPAHP